MDNTCIQEEKDILPHWTSEGWEFLLQNEDYRSLAVDTLSKILDIYSKVEFKYKEFYYEIFESSQEQGYVVNIYSSGDKDKDGYYLKNNMIDGGLCTGSAKDAIEFML